MLRALLTAQLAVQPDRDKCQLALISSASLSTSAPRCVARLSGALGVRRIPGRLALVGTHPLAGPVNTNSNVIPQLERLSRWPRSSRLHTQHNADSMPFMLMLHSLLAEATQNARSPRGASACPLGPTRNWPRATYSNNKLPHKLLMTRELSAQQPRHIPIPTLGGSSRAPRQRREVTVRPIWQLIQFI